ncbi:hypothetical protein CDD81_3426 [Ophiocordyceps australis]|uniref:Uncharacterized protein n=1 Tax=Ophiocordyceps australis TaxID=1399860 RepID=A0A2C5XJM7_9HYPO|nr:hypothetical protein CDD81_3426 [Ophiocordyceps australis]
MHITTGIHIYRPLFRKTRIASGGFTRSDWHVLSALCCPLDTRARLTQPGTALQPAMIVVGSCLGEQSFSRVSFGPVPGHY